MRAQFFLDVMNKMRKIIGALSLLILFVAYQASITAFTHVHYINGVLITHSHPFCGAHSHTKTEILVIDRLSHFLILDQEPVEMLHPLRPLLAVVDCEPILSEAQIASRVLLSLRAPPF